MILKGKKEIMYVRRCKNCGLIINIIEKRSDHVFAKKGKHCPRCKKFVKVKE
jgi:predicted Zn-ribbon and HTH transcriptional regulator